MEPEPAPPIRRFSAGENALMWMGLLLPGALSPFAVIFAIGLAYSGNRNLPLFGIPILWLAILLGCCWMCGWIHAHKRGPENLKARAAKTGALFLLGQVLLTPTLGFGACLIIMNTSFF